MRTSEFLYRARCRNISGSSDEVSNAIRAEVDHARCGGSDIGRLQLLPETNAGPHAQHLELVDEPKHEASLVDCSASQRSRGLQLAGRGVNAT